MSNKVVHLDTTKIVSIHEYKETEANYWEWRPEIKERSYLFGLIRLEGKKAGWVDTAELWDSDDRLGDDKLKKKGYKVYPWNERVTNRVVRMAHVKVVFVNGYEYNCDFGTNTEMNNWIKDLKISIANKKFILV